MAGVLRLPRLHFDKHDRAAIEHDEVQFARPEPIAPGENLVSPSFQVGGGRLLAPSPQGLLGKGEKPTKPAGQRGECMGGRKKGLAIGD